MKVLRLAVWGVVACAALAGRVNGQASPAARPGVGGAGAGATAASGNPIKFKDTNLPFDVRVADPASRLSLPDKATEILETVHDNTQLGIPGVQWWTEAIHGVSRAGAATVYPQAIGMAASWDPALLKKVGDSIATEARAKIDPGESRYRGIILWAPTINMARDPRWGRVEETYGETYLTSRMAIGYIQGVQGDDPKYLKTVATPKHFAMYSQETQRMSRSFECPETVLRDYYLPAFRDSFIEGHATSTMSAFNGINQIPCTANFWLLTEVLRKEWGFEGAVVTDWGAVSQLYEQQRDVNSLEQAVTTALNAGVDVICDVTNDRNVPTYEQQRASAPMVRAIVQAVNEKSLKEDVVNRALTRNLMLRFRLGMFDPPAMVPYQRIKGSEVGTEESQALALQMALESMVLLKNDPAPRGFGGDKLLPLDLRRIDSIAVLGPNANSNQYGAYPGSPANAAPTMVTAIRAAVGDRVTVRTEVSSDTDYNVKAAQASSVVVFVCGLNSSIEREGTDRASLRLPDDQLNLLQKVVKANPLTIVLLVTGGPVALVPVADLVPAIMVGWYSGEQGAVAAAQLLLGQANPSGKLPMTFYRANDDLPALDDYDIRKGRTYMYATKPPTYVFGAGISYTAFKYDHLKVTPDAADAAGTFAVTLDVTNTGRMDGDEVVQLYVREKNPQANLQRPLKQLKAFARVRVPAGQTRAVTLNVPVERLGFWSVAEKKYVADKGVYEIQVGSSSEDIRVKADVSVK